MFNHWPYNHAPYAGNNFGFAINENPTYSPSVITSIGRAQQGLSVPKFIMGGRGGPFQDTYAIFKKSPTYEFSMWRSQRFLIGRPFNILGIKIPLTASLVGDELVIPILNFDNGERLVPGTRINLEQYPDTPAYITLSPYTFGANVHGERDFSLEFHFLGTAFVGIGLPITIELQTENVG